jgi:hypothetical protein
VLARRVPALRAAMVHNIARLQYPLRQQFHAPPCVGIDVFDSLERWTKLQQHEIRERGVRDHGWRCATGDVREKAKQQARN